MMTCFGCGFLGLDKKGFPVKAWVKVWPEADGERLKYFCNEACLQRLREKGWQVLRPRWYDRFVKPRQYERAGKFFHVSFRAFDLYNPMGLGFRVFSWIGKDPNGEFVRSYNIDILFLVWDLQFGFHIREE